MTAAVLEDIRALTDDGLADLLADSFASDDEQAQRAAMAEAARRDRADRQREARAAEWAEYTLAQHADYLAAVDATNGNLLSRPGIAAGIDEQALWTGPAARAERYASEELRAWWDEHGRLTISEWRAAMQADRSAERIAALMVAELDIDDEPEVTVTTVDAEADVADTVMGIPTCADDEPQETLLLSQRPYLPLGDVVVMYGPGSVGKGRINMAVIADVTNGRPIGLDTEADEPADVIVILPEDKHAEQVIPRLIAAGADRRRVHNLTRLPDGSRFKLSASPKHPGHLPVLAAFIEALRAKGRNPRLVVIDPVAAAVGEGTIQTNKGARQMIEPVQDMADDLGVTVIMVAHPTKAGVLQGSAGLEQAARVVYRIRRDEVNSAHRVLELVKGNNVPPALSGELRFTIAEDAAGRARAIWLDRAVIEARKANWRDELAERRKARAAVAQPVQAAATETADPRALLEQARANHARRLLARVTGGRP